MPPGLFYYAYTYFNGVGETTISPTSWVDFGANYSVLVICPASPSPGITQTYVYRSDASGNGLYLAGVINGNGGSVADRYDVFGRTAPTTNTTGISGALVPGATYHWKVKFVTATGETVPGVDSATTLPTIYNGVLLSNVPTSPDGRVVKRRIYRTKANALDNMYFEAEITNNTTTTFASDKADSALGAVMSVADSTGTGALVARRLVYVARDLRHGDRRDDRGRVVDELGRHHRRYGAALECAHLAGHAREQAEGVSLPSGALETRRHHRRQHDDHLHQFKSRMRPLGAALPTSNTTHGSGGLVMGGYYAWARHLRHGERRDDGAVRTRRGSPSCPYDNTASLTAIATSPDVRVVARRVYRTRHGGGQWYLEATINDNTTTTFTRTKTDGATRRGRSRRPTRRARAG